jgi:hypothetical protein
MSEGISFNDENARCVICIGLPYPCFTDRAVKAKRSYNDEQRKIRKNTNLLPGDEWYSQQAHRAIAQALGRCIRHVSLLTVQSNQGHTSLSQYVLESLKLTLLFLFLVIPVIRVLITVQL